MVVTVCERMVQVDKKYVVCHEAASDEGIGEVINRQSEVVHIQGLVNGKLFLVYFILSPGFLPECPQIKQTVIHVSNGVLVALSILLDLL